eukprot:gene22688-28837_t
MASVGGARSQDFTSLSTESNNSSNWHPVAVLPEPIASVAANANGQHVALLVGDYLVYYSINYGRNFTESVIPSQLGAIYSIASGGSGQNMSLISGGSSASFSVSNDYGASWNLRFQSGVQNSYFLALAMSNDSKIVFLGGTTTSLYKSVDYGMTFDAIVRQEFYYATQIVCSYSGQYVIVLANKPTFSLSSNAGETWINIVADFNPSYMSMSGCACDSTGQFVLFTTGGALFQSANYGHSGYLGYTTDDCYYFQNVNLTQSELTPTIVATPMPTLFHTSAPVTMAPTSVLPTYELDALQVFYDATGGPEWYFTDVTDDYSSTVAIGNIWNFTESNPSPYYIHLEVFDLSNNQFNGKMPTLAANTQLNALNLSSNQFSVRILSLMRNPCPGILAPQLMGYDTKYASSSIMTWKLDMASVVTALAVNMGILPLTTLTNIKGDNDRINLLNNMAAQGFIDQQTVYNASSYFASCFVRQGNMLMYPVISHYGYSETGLDYPSICTAKNVAERGTAAFYYCNRFDLAVGLIYYPVENIDIDAALKTATKGPSKQPSVRPTPGPGPGKPTCKPTFVPSAKPSLTFPPTRSPSNTATPSWTRRPTVRPTERPTPLPGNPTKKPSFKPTGRPSTTGSPSTSFAPSVSSRPSWTFKPSRPTATPSISKAPDSTSNPSKSPDSTHAPSVSFRPSNPTQLPTTHAPSLTPSRAPSAVPSLLPSEEPTLAPSMEPSVAPVTAAPSVSIAPSESPTTPPTESLSARRRLGEIFDALSGSSLTSNGGSSSGGASSNGGSGGGSSGGGASSGGGEESSGHVYYHTQDHAVLSNGSGVQAVLDPTPRQRPPVMEAFPRVLRARLCTDDVVNALPAAPSDDYSGSKSNDDFAPQVQENIDNGKIFAFGKDAALSLVQKGDVYMTAKAYPALISTIVGESDKGSTFRKDFNGLCKGSVSSTGVNVPGGCAMMAFEVFGGDNRQISTYAFQPGISPAFYNTFYDVKTMFKLSKTPPTVLIETYYSCVNDQWNSFYNAAGLANSNVQLYLTVAFMVYMYLIVFRCAAKTSSSRRRRRSRWPARKMRFDALVEDSKAGDANHTSFKHAIAMTEIRDLDETRPQEVRILDDKGGEISGVRPASRGGDVELTETGYGGNTHQDYEQVRHYDDHEQV